MFLHGFGIVLFNLQEVSSKLTTAYLTGNFAKTVNLGKF